MRCLLLFSLSLPFFALLLTPPTQYPLRNGFTLANAKMAHLTREQGEGAGCLPTPGRCPLPQPLLNLPPFLPSSLPPSPPPEFFGEFRGRPGFQEAVAALCAGPLVALEIIGSEAVAKWQRMMGPSDPSRAASEAPDTLRARFGRCVWG